MQGLLISNKNRRARDQLAALFVADDYQVTTTDSVVNALEGIFNKTIQVVVLGGDFDEMHVTKLIPLLKKCNPYLSVILIADEVPLGLLRRIRNEGIFYHALKPTGEEGLEEVYQAVRCAFRTCQAQRDAPESTQSKEVPMRNVKTILTSLVLLLMAGTPALAADAGTTYTSGLLVLIFIGFCALLIVVQLLPAIRSLFGITKDAAEKTLDSSKLHAPQKKD